MLWTNPPAYFANETMKSFKTFAPVHKFWSKFTHSLWLDHFRAMEKGLVINETVQLTNKE
jgi:hypothetical protein